MFMVFFGDEILQLLLSPVSSLLLPLLLSSLLRRPRVDNENVGTSIKGGMDVACSASDTETH